MLSWTNVCLAALVARGARSDALRGRLRDNTLLQSDADLLSALMHINGFEAPRLDKKCGAEFAHAGCDPTSATPCCEGGRCVASAQCVSGHEHSQHVCNAAAWDSPTPQERACDHCATPWQCTRRDRTASASRVAEDAASLKALSGEALRETRVLLRFRGQVVRHAIDANPTDADEMKRLMLLAEQTTAKMELLSDLTKSAAELASSAAEDIEWLKRLGGDPKKLGALLNKLTKEAATAVPKVSSWDAPTMLRELDALFGSSSSSSAATTSNAHIALLRDEVVRKNAFAVASPRFLSSHQFDISKCCASVDFFVWKVTGEESLGLKKVHDHVSLQPDPGSAKDEIAAWANDPALSAYHATSREEACLKVTTTAAWRPMNREQYVQLFSLPSLSLSLSQSTGVMTEFSFSHSDIIAQVAPQDS